MKPVRRKIRRHFGLTAKQVAVHSKRPWYFQLLASLIMLTLGFILAYWYCNDGINGNLREKMQQTALENQALQTKLISVERDLQIKQAMQDNLAKDLAKVQDESIKIKADLIFYQNMLDKKAATKR